MYWQPCLGTVNLPWPTAGLRGRGVDEKNNSVCFPFKKQNWCSKSREGGLPRACDSSASLGCYIWDESSQKQDRAILALLLLYETGPTAFGAVAGANVRRKWLILWWTGSKEGQKGTKILIPISGWILQGCTMTATLPSAFWEFCNLTGSASQFCVSLASFAKWE